MVVGIVEQHVMAGIGILRRQLRSGPQHAVGAERPGMGIVEPVSEHDLVNAVLKVGDDIGAVIPVVDEVVGADPAGQNIESEAAFERIVASARQ